MTYQTKNCSIYVECIAISPDAASFNVEIFHRTSSTLNEKIGKANVLVPRHPALINDKNSYSLMIFDGNVDNTEELVLTIGKMCAERCKALSV